MLCFTVFTTFVATLSLYIGTLRAARVTHDYLLQKIMHAPMSFFDQTPIGRLVNRFSKDVDEVDNSLPATIRAFSACFFGVINIKNYFKVFILRVMDILVLKIYFFFVR